MDTISQINNFEQSFSGFIQSSKGLPLPMLVLISLGGGLASSLTPCVLSMLPMNLSYIGTAHIASKKDALRKASLFVVGAALIFTLLGLFASFASLVMVEYRGYIHTAIGAFILIMALSLLEIIKVPLPQVVTQIPNGGPFIVGVAFALVSSPCASPILFAILALSTSTGSLIGGALIMVAYSIGYTAIIFLSSLFAGITKQLNFFKKHNKIITIISSIVLALLGCFYLYSGIMWFIG